MFSIHENDITCHLFKFVFISPKNIFVVYGIGVLQTFYYTYY